MTEYRRFRHPGGIWFFTVNLAERHGNRLLIDRIDTLRSAFAHVKSTHSFEIKERGFPKANGEKEAYGRGGFGSTLSVTKRIIDSTSITFIGIR